VGADADAGELEPAEFFLFVWGALIGFAAVVVVRILVARRRS